MEKKEIIIYDENWIKQLKQKPKDFLVDFLRNSLIKIHKLKLENVELKNKINNG